jgi:hypothetical protein
MYQNWGRAERGRFRDLATYDIAYLLLDISKYFFASIKTTLHAKLKCSYLVFSTTICLQIELNFH